MNAELPLSAVRVALPLLLRRYAGTDAEVTVSVAGPVTLAATLDALERDHPVLRGAIRDSTTQQRRALVRFFACELDFSHSDPSDALPEAVAAGLEPLLIVGAIAGG